MIFKKVCTCILYILVTCYCESDCKEIELINHLVTKNLVENLKTRQVTLFVKSLDKVSSLSAFIIRRFVETLPCLMIHVQELTIMKAENARLILVKKLLKRRSERSSLKVVILDVKKDLNAVEELIEIINFMSTHFAKIARGRCIIFFVNHKNNQSLGAFFQFAWSHKFLDLTIIELTHRDHHKNCCFNASIHQFNPFYDLYYKEILTMNTNVFPNKLHDFNGFILYTSFFEDIPFVMIDLNYSGKNIWDMVQGLDVLITRTLAETLNFTAIVRVVNSENSNFRRFNVTAGDTDHAIANDVIDFAVNFYAIIASISLESFQFEPCAFLFPFSNHLIVKQFGSYETSVSLDLVISISIILIIVLILWMFIKLLHFNENIWTFYSILKILIGRTMKHQNSLKVYEKIFFLCMIAVSAIISFQLLEHLVDFYLLREKFLKLQTLQDLVDSGIIPSITNDSKLFLSNSDYPPLQDILAHSTTIETKEEVSACVNDLLISNKERPVNGCEVNTVLGKLLSSSFSSGNNGWILSLVREPLQPAWTALAVTKTSPYAHRFDAILRKFYEAGLINFWYKAMMRNYSLNYKDLTGDVMLHTHKTKSSYMKQFFDNRKIPLHVKLTVVLICGHIASCVVFGCEIIWKCYVLKICALMKVKDWFRGVL